MLITFDTYDHIGGQCQVTPQVRRGVLSGEIRTIAHIGARHHQVTRRIEKTFLFSDIIGVDKFLDAIEFAETNSTSDRVTFVVRDVANEDNFSTPIIPPVDIVFLTHGVRH